jgi:hypothetical protein
LGHQIFGLAEILADDDSEMSEIDTDSEQEDVLSGEDEYIPNSGDEIDNQDSGDDDDKYSHFDVSSFILSISILQVKKGKIG